jgi:hypothetical protein
VLLEDDGCLCGVCGDAEIIRALAGQRDLAASDEALEATRGGS